MKRLAQATGVLENTVLLNFRTDAEVLRRLLPSPFEPRLVDGYGMVGILLFTMKNLTCETTMGLPSPPSDHVLYRIAVSWNHGGRTYHGMYLLRHEVNTRLPVRQRRRGLFPVAGQPVRWHKEPGSQQFEWTLKSKTKTKLQISASVSSSFSSGSVFSSLEEASDFFAQERAAIAPRFQKSIFSNTHFLPLTWPVKPLFVEKLTTDIAQLQNLFPKGQIFFDSGLIWPKIPCKWQEGREILASRPIAIPSISEIAADPVKE